MFRFMLPHYKGNWVLLINEMITLNQGMPLKMGEKGRVRWPFLKFPKFAFIFIESVSVLKKHSIKFNLFKLNVLEVLGFYTIVNTKYYNYHHPHWKSSFSINSNYLSLKWGSSLYPEEKKLIKLFKYALFQTVWWPFLFR